MNRAGPTLDRAQEGLADDQDLVHGRPHPPSPGELMDQANVLARDLQYDAEGRDGRVLLRSWGEVVEAAGEVWRRLPGRHDPASGGPDIMTQLERSARVLCGRSNDAVVPRRHGPADDPTMQQIRDLLERAAEVIDRSEMVPAATRGGHVWSQPQLRDAFAARVSLIHTLYLSAHGTSLALTGNVALEKTDRTRLSHVARLRVVQGETRKVPAEQVRDRVAALEELSYSFLHGHFPGAFDHRHQPPPDPGRLSRAVSAWDVQAQRLLARRPRTVDLLGVASTTARAAGLSHRLWEAAAEAGRFDAGAHEHELSPAVDGMIDGWGRVAAHLSPLHHPQERPDRALHEAAREVLAAFRELASDRGRPATPSLIAERVDLDLLIRDLHHFHATATTTGPTFQEAVAEAALDVSARPAHQMLTERLDLDGPIPPPHEQAPISPRALVNRSAVPLPETLRSRLLPNTDRAVRATDSALRAVHAVADHTTRRGRQDSPATRTRTRTERPPMGLANERRGNGVTAVGHDQAVPR